MVGPYLSLAVLFGFCAAQSVHIDRTSSKCRVNELFKDKKLKPCQVYRCRRGVYPITVKGLECCCLEKQYCYPEHGIGKNNCSEYTCIKDYNGIHSHGYLMLQTTPRCSWKGKCYDLEKHGYHNCSRYTCKEKNSELQMPLTKQRCSWNRKCYDVGKTANFRCSKYTCRVVDSVLHMSLTTLKCERGGCHALGKEIFIDSCSRYVCTKKSENSATFELHEYCKYGTTCYLLDTVHKDGCHRFRCEHSLSNGSLINVRLQSECWDGKTCHAVGSPDYFMDGCKLYRCSPRVGFDVDHDYLDEYCQLNDECRPLGHEYFKNGCERYVCTNQPDGTIGYLFEKENTCCVRGSVFQDGHNFTPPGDSKCVEFNCSKGVVTTVKEGCELNNTCVSLEDYADDECRNVTCIKISAGPKFEYILNATKIDCKVGDTCKPVGYEHYIGICNHFACINTPENTVDYVLKEYCLVGNTCQPLGAQYLMDGCRLHRCSRTLDGNVTHVFIEQYCQYGHACQPVGSVYYKNGCERHVCTNQSDGTVGHVIQEDSGCCFRGVRYDNEQIFTPPGEDRCIKYRCSEGIRKLHAEGCDVNGTCYPVGENHFTNCSVLTCNKFELRQGTRYQAFLKTTGCHVGDTCLPEGSVHYTNSCEIHVCSRTSEQTPTLVLQTKSCLAGDRCIPVGSVHYKNSCDGGVCNSTREDAVALVPQNKSFCCHLGDVYGHGQVFVISGIRNCSKYRCDHGVVRLIEEGCVIFDNCIGKEDMEKIQCSIYTCVQTERNSSDYQIALKKTYTCCMGGSVFKDGKTFTPPGNTECVKYHCSKGNATLIREGCQRNNTCIPPGGTFEEGCRILNCTKIPVGSGFEYRLLETKTACEFNDRCIHLGDSVEHKCRNFTCTKIPVGHDLKYQLLVTPTGCELDRHCIPFGGSVELQCSTHICTKIAEGPGIGSQLVVTRTDCQDGDVCVPLDAVHYMNGCERYVCTNTSNGTLNFSFQKEDTCCMGGSVFKDGEMFTPPGHSECVKCRCSMGDVVYIREGCDRNGTCIPLGTIFQHECRTINCTKIEVGSSFDYQLVVTRNACELNNTCVALGQSVDQQCRTFTCTQIPEGSEFEYQLLETRTDCQFGDACIPVDSAFYVDLCERYVCTKQSNDTMDVFSMKENTTDTCCVGGAVFQDGETFTPPEAKDCTKFRCLKGENTIIKKGC